MGKPGLWVIVFTKVHPQVINGHVPLPFHFVQIGFHFGNVVQMFGDWPFPKGTGGQYGTTGKKGFQKVRAPKKKGDQKERGKPDGDGYQNGEPFERAEAGQLKGGKKKKNNKHENEIENVIDCLCGCVFGCYYDENTPGRKKGRDTKAAPKSF